MCLLSLKWRIMNVEINELNWDSCPNALYSITIPDSDLFQSSTQPQFLREHTMDVASIGTQWYSARNENRTGCDGYVSEWTSRRHTTALQHRSLPHANRWLPVLRSNWLHHHGPVTRSDSLLITDYAVSCYSFIIFTGDGCDWSDRGKPDLKPTTIL